MTKIIKGSELSDKELEVLEDGTLRIIDGFKPQKFEPINGERYYFVDSYGMLNWCKWDNSKYNNRQLKRGKLFNTREECEHYQEYLERRDELSRDFVRGNDNWYMFYKHISKTIEYDLFNQNKHQGVTYFKTKEDIKTLINEFGEKFILAWEFNVYE